MKTVILSTNDHNDYFPYLEYVQLAWNVLGYNTLTFYLGENEVKETPQNRIVKINSIEGYKDVTVLQCARLFGHRYVKEGQIMTSDVDMIPMQRYWFDDKTIIVYGADLLRNRQFPMCYISAGVENWDKIIPENDIKELLDKYPCAKSEGFDEYWYTDQIIVTERIKKLPHTIHKRGNVQGFAYGRVDRAIWDKSLNAYKGKYIDAHMPKGFDKEKTEQIMGLIKI